MADGDASQNQGNQQPIDPSNEVKSDVVDQKKLDRAAKERERRRRRRKKAELKRLERETLQQQGDLPKSDAAAPSEPKPEPQKQPEVQPQQKLEVRPEQKKTELPAGPKKAPRKRKPRPAPKENVSEEHLGAQRSEEHTSRSKDIVPQAEPERELPESEIVHEENQQPPEESVLEPEQQEDHPMTHQTHSFTGPLIEPAVPEPVEPQPSPPSPEPEPEQPSQQENQPEEQHEQAQEFRQNQQDEDIIIRDQHEEARPHVDMREVHEVNPLHDEVIPGEVPSIFPPEKFEEGQMVHEEPEEIEPIRQPRKPLEEDVQKTQEQHEASKENLSESEGLNTRKSFLQSAGAFSAGVLKSIGAAFHNFRLKFNVKKLGIFIVFVVIGGLLYTGYLFNIHGKIYDYVAGFFKTPAPVQAQLDNELLNEWGITTAYIFGDNRGSSHDLLGDQITNSYYFGTLGEPQVQGETGITASYYYGTGADLVAQTDEFIGFVNDLRQLVSSYDVDVYAMLNQTTQREQALDNYVTELKTITDKSTADVAKINTEIDDAKVSYDSLSPDTTQFQSDFFTALKGLAGQKADFLLKSYVDSAQKQVAIKARIDALQNLLTYFTSAMQNVAIRLTSVQQNHAALVQGIHVVNIPGANLNIILQPQ